MKAYQVANSPQDRYLRQALGNIETDTGLLNADCSAIPIMIFTTDHRAKRLDCETG
jgi:hypothetical protein